MTFGPGSDVPFGESKTTTTVFVPSDRTAAMRDPSGDHVGNPYIPSEVSSRGVEAPSDATTEIEPSSARTAIEPVDPIGPAEAAVLAAAVTDGEGPGAEDAGLVEGVVLAQAPARSAVSAIARIRPARCAIS
jgi:hypothetical protein